MLHEHHFVDTKQRLDMNLIYNLMQKKTLSLTHVSYGRSMNRNSSLLFLARRKYTSLIEMILDFPIQTYSIPDTERNDSRH